MADCKMMTTSLSGYMMEYTLPLYASDNIGLHFVSRLCHAAITVVALVEAVVRLILAVPALAVARCLDNNAKTLLAMSTLIGSAVTIQCALIAITSVVTTFAITISVAGCIEKVDHGLFPCLANLYGVENFSMN